MVESRRLLDTRDDNSPLGDNRRGSNYNMRKIVVVGDSGVGKTAIVSRFVSG